MLDLSFVKLVFKNGHCKKFLESVTSNSADSAINSQLLLKTHERKENFFK